MWCGGTLETHLGRAADVALAARQVPCCRGDTSASYRYYRQDVTTQPFVLEDGHARVPTARASALSRTVPC